MNYMISPASCLERVARQWQLEPDGFPEFRKKNQEMGEIKAASVCGAEYWKGDAQGSAEGPR